MLHKNKTDLSPDNWLKKEDDIQYIAVVRPYNKKELCHMYSISHKTFKAWTTPFEKQLGKKAGAYYTILQVSLIFSKLGAPMR